ncbi:50S ribosomal protein L3 N(5)-glutamine methyltransferase [Comamonadaceae bacterium G21597-S1]|nr:50S ribosomal protein L3 N(5)-glutamine methyltransferase [Comamonadaceae bacterium G21597-S1]
MTIGQLIDASAQALEAAGVSFGHGTTNAWDEAAWLVLWRLGLPLDTELDGPHGVAERVVDATDADRVRSLVQQRIDSRKPAAYLTGEAWLQGVPFHVDERCIVPRSLIGELLAAGVLDSWMPQDAQRLLDLCTGGGSLAILAAMAWPQLQVDAADISVDALAVARINLQRHGLEQRIRLRQGDGLAAAQGVYDMILCNPPYVNSASMAQLPAEYRAEPELALAGGADGMDFVRRLLRDAGDRLQPHGALVLEIGHERAFFEAAFPGLPALWLETSAGADQVCLLGRDALLALPTT